MNGTRMNRARMSSAGARLAYSFSGCGLLASYHLGVWDALTHRGSHAFNPTTKPLIGASGGALVAGVMTSGVVLSDASDALRRIVADILSVGTGGILRVDLLSLVRRELERLLPEDAHERCNGKVTVCVSDVSKLPWRRPRPVLIDGWSTRSSLVESLLTSSYIPYITARGPQGDLTGASAAFDRVPTPCSRPMVDGGLANNFPTHPAPDVCTIRVSPFAGELDICPHADGDLTRGKPLRLLLPAGVRVDASRRNASAAWRALAPASTNVEGQHACGYDDACRWLRDQGGSSR